MEYYINLTYNCNLSCSYCAAKKVVFGKTNNPKIISKSNLDKILYYIISDSNLRQEKNYIVFYGGEPTLEMSLIEYVIERTKNYNLKYVLYTNGLLLDKTEKVVLNKLEAIFISIDGDKETHDFFKFKGSFEKVIKNTRLVRQISGVKTIARITLQEESNLFNSVVKIYPDFDFVFWQIVNKPLFNNPQKFITSYNNNIKLLYNYWVTELLNNNFIKIIPFIALLDKKLRLTQNMFKCGMGLNQINIDINGNTYLCDEYIGDIDHICGNINDPGNIKINQKNNYEIFYGCEKCEVSSICAGRCRHALETYKTDTIQTYCALTKIIIAEVKKIDISKYVSYEDIELIKLTEQIP